MATKIVGENRMICATCLGLESLDCSLHVVKTFPQKMIDYHFRCASQDIFS